LSRQITDQHETDIVTTLDTLWSDVLESHAAKVAESFERALSYREVSALLLRPSEVQCAVSDVVALPYLTMMCREFGRDDRSFYVRTFSESDVSAEQDELAQQCHRMTSNLPIKELFDALEPQWNPGLSTIVDVALLYSIWCATESGVFAANLLYAKVLACIQQDAPFLPVYIACVILENSKAKSYADDTAIGEFPWGGFAACSDYLSQYSEAIQQIESP